MSERLSLYVVTPPGLERWTALELSALGFSATVSEPGGLALDATLLDAARLNLELRTASRVLVRRAAFHVRALGELERKAAKLPWGEWLPAGGTVALRVTCRKSRLYHQGAVRERIGNAIHAVTGLAPVAAVEEEVEEAAPAQLIVVRLYRDECSISLDSSGDHLHRRGYRLATAKAPLRETLAAGLLAAAEWDPTTPLLDPFCGSGTIPIEAALLARRMPPGLHRRFACEIWPGWDAAAGATLRAEAVARILPRAPAPIQGSDRDAGAIGAATSNAERAGVADSISWRQAAVSAVEPVPGPGLLLANPPYGHRVGGEGDLRDLYARLGQVARERLPGWRVALLLPEAPLERATGLRFGPPLHLQNGGLAVRLLVAEVPRG